jgi:hypothetical protein
MTRAATRTSTADRLAQHLFATDAASDLSDEVAAWLSGSARFRAFADAHRDKIRKKLRTAAADADALRDVRAELRVAHLLLSNRRIELAFEAHGSGRGGPDFTVTFRGSAALDLEVTRLRGDPGAATHGGPLLAKLRQLPPSVPNVLLIALEGDRSNALDVASAVRELRARADAKDEAFFQRRAFEGTRDFYHRFLRLGAVATWCEGGIADTRVSSWRNGSARIPVPEPALRACLAALGGDGG